MTKDTGGPAFPGAHLQNANGDIQWGSDGMTLRDYFAAKALTGAQQWDAIINGKNSPFAKDGNGPELLAIVAYKIADAMLRERAK